MNNSPMYIMTDKSQTYNTSHILSATRYWTYNVCLFQMHVFCVLNVIFYFRDDCGFSHLPYKKLIVLNSDLL